MVWLSPSPVTGSPSDQLAGQPSCRERRGGKQNDQTNYKSTVGYGGDGGIRFEYQLTSLEGEYNNPQLLAYYTTHTTIGNNNKSTAADKDGQGIPGVSTGGSRGK